MKQDGVIVLAGLVAACIAGAQPPAARPETAVGKLVVDWAVPESPAFVVLGATPQTVSRPSSPQQLATSLLNGVDQNGNFQTGVALDTQPYLLLYGHRVSYRAYADNPVTRFLSRLQLSLGTTKGANEADKSAKLAVGFRFTVFDKGDQYLNERLARCIADAQAEALQSAGVPPPPGNAAAEAEFKKKLLAAVEPLEAKCRASDAEDYRKSRWNNSSMVVGVAPSWSSTTGNTSDLAWNGGAVWVSVAYGFEGTPALEDNSQLIFHYRYRSKEQAPDPLRAGEFLEQDSSVLGARWRFGNADTTGSFEYVFLRRDMARGGSDDSHRIGLGAERRLAGNLWLGVTLGTERGRVDRSNKAFVLTSFNWSLNRKD